MSGITVVPCAARLLLMASTLALIACSGDAAGPETPNPAGVPDTIVFSLQAPEVVIGDTLRLSVVARDVNGNIVPGVVLTWRSLNPVVATVSPDGLVTTLDIGEAEIEVEADVPGNLALAVDSSGIGRTSLRRVRSKAKIVSIPNVVVTPGSATVAVADKQLFQARITNLNDIVLRNRPETKWTSSSPAVATITSDGLATAVGKGSTTITATITVGPSSNVKKTATLTVTDALCGGIGLVETLQGQVFYDYATSGTAGESVIGSEYHGQVKATMTSTGWQAGVPTVLWSGPLSGAASQVETVHDKTGKETQRMQGAGPTVGGIGLSFMSVVVDLKTCTYRVIVEVAIDLTWTVNGKPFLIGPSSVRLYVGAGKKLSTTSAPGDSPFPLVADVEFPGHSLAFEAGHPQDDLFIPHGLAAQLIQAGGVEPPLGKGNASVSYGITVVKP